MRPSVHFESPVERLDCGDGHAGAVLADGTVRLWGLRGEGRLGHGLGSTGAEVVRLEEAITPALDYEA